MTDSRQVAPGEAAVEVHLLRHGESTFNAGIDPLALDARLTDRGRDQALAAADRVRSLGVDLVVSSPLTRALQTAQIVAGGTIPIVVEALLTEWQVNHCDVGRAASVLRSEFQGVSFGPLAETWWYDGAPDERGVALEPEAAFLARVVRLREWVRAARARRILLVGHHACFLQLAGVSLRNGELVRLGG
jgi:broad specificity phosphatase PhoE